MTDAPPDWLQARLTRVLATLDQSPDPAAAVLGIAAHHGCDPEAVVLTSGDAHARALLASVVHAEAPEDVVLGGLDPAWSTAGLRAGYVIAPVDLARRLRALAAEALPGPIELAALAAMGPAPSTTGPGQVTLIGAGPGDPELLTRRAWAALHAADVVVTDRLVNDRILGGLAPWVTLVDAGKAPGEHRLSQEEINAVLVDHALRGSSVARLKGGDPFVFGRGSEEVLACAAAGIAVTVIPGLSTAISAPTLAGIPVTHRGVARSFAVLSGHLPPGHPANPVDWAQVATSVDTLVLLMSVGNLPAITAVLLSVLPPETPAAIVQDAASDRQRVSTLTLQELPRADVRNPAVVIIGPTVGLL